MGWIGEIKSRLSEFYQELNSVCLKYGRSSGDIDVLYATKYLSSDQLYEFIPVASTFRNPVILGENRVQAAEKKFSIAASQIPSNVVIKKIMMGTLQKNKINKTLDLFDEIHSIDSLELAKSIDMRLNSIQKTLYGYLEVNISKENTKHGVKEEDLDDCIKSLKKFNYLKITGLMTMAPLTEDEALIRSVFKKLRTQADRYKLKTSMGMSHDWKIAVEEGSDMVRIGSRLFKTDKPYA